jgi:hypothetical protein
VGDESERPWEAMWKFWPEMADSMEDSTEGKGCSSDMSAGGGVSALLSGEAVYECSCEAMKGGIDLRLSIMWGDMKGDCGTLQG